MRITTDALSLQAAHHYDCVKWRTLNYSSPSAGRRLSDFYTLIKSYNCEINDSRSTDLVITDDLLRDHHLLAIFTRTKLAPFLREEINRIVTFVREGGFLLHLSNHPPLGRGKIDYTDEDEKLSSRFGVHFNADLFPEDGGESGETTISLSSIHQHEITKLLKKGIIFRNSCTITLNLNSSFLPLINLPYPAKDDHYFAVCGMFGEGLAVFMANSGFLCNNDTTTPGKGYFNCADNALFGRKVIEYFLKNL